MNNDEEDPTTVRIVPDRSFLEQEEEPTQPSFLPENEKIDTIPSPPPVSLDQLPFLGYISFIGDLPKPAQVIFLILMAAVVAASLGFCTPRIARAGSAECGFIKDNDRRHFCWAITIPRPSECSFIRDNDLRHECRARTSKK